MIESIPESADLGKAHARAIAMLSEKLHLPVQAVQQVYLEELGRLESQARIRSYLDVLALGSTQSILRSGNGRGTRS